MKLSTLPDIRLILFIGLLILILVGLINNARTTEKLQKSHTIVCGRVLDMRFGKGVNVIFSYTYNGKVYTQNISSPAITYDNYKKGDYNLLIVINKEDPNTCEILTKSSQFEDLNINEKDTLNVRCN